MSQQKRAAKVNDADYPPVQFISYVYDDPEEAPVIDVSLTLEECRTNTVEAGGGFIYRLEKSEDVNADGLPIYENESFIEEHR